MKRSLIVVLVAGAIVLAFGPVSSGQAQNPLVGSWERISLLDGTGKPVQPPVPPAFLIFSSDGFFSQNAIPAGRPKNDKPLDQLTKEELLALFNRVEARRGTYTIAGNRLTRKNIASVNTSVEGTENAQLFHVENGVLILTNTDPKLKNEARFRRAK
jgi:hypothetical protein